MQTQLFCATCATPLNFKVPDLTGYRWHAHCQTCGETTALEANLGEADEVATFKTAGVFI